MEGSKIPTAKEFLIVGKYKDSLGNLLMYAPQAQTAMIQFAKLHVEAALKAASENVRLEIDNPITKEIMQKIYSGEIKEYKISSVNKDSILNAYPLEQIK